jgi:hypothetical protein
MGELFRPHLPVQGRGAVKHVDNVALHNIVRLAHISPGSLVRYDYMKASIGYVTEFANQISFT